MRKDIIKRRFLNWFSCTFSGKPKFRREPQKMYVRHLGNSVKLKCPVTGTGNPFPNKTLVSWFKGANVINNTHSNWSRFLIKKDKHLKIVNVKEGDAGTYKCRGRNKYGFVDLIIQLKVKRTYSYLLFFSYPLEV